MLELKGDLWEHAPEYDAICCTTNSVVKRDGTLVMGAGIALGFANRYPKLAYNWGTRIEKMRLFGIQEPGAFITLTSQKPHLIYFQTKTHWKDPSLIDLIKVSLYDLCSMIHKLNLNKVLLPRPGCANGGLDWYKDVLPAIGHILDQYQNHITVISK